LNGKINKTVSPKITTTETKKNQKGEGRNRLVTPKISGRGIVQWHHTPTETGGRGGDTLKKGRRKKKNWEVVTGNGVPHEGWMEEKSSFRGVLRVVVGGDVRKWGGGGERGRVEGVGASQEDKPLGTNSLATGKMVHRIHFQVTERLASRILTCGKERKKKGQNGECTVG